MVFFSFFFFSFFFGFPSSSTRSNNLAASSAGSGGGGKSGTPFTTSSKKSNSSLSLIAPFKCTGLIIRAPCANAVSAVALNSFVKNSSRAFAITKGVVLTIFPTSSSFCIMRLIRAAKLAFLLLCENTLLLPLILSQFLLLLFLLLLLFYCCVCLIKVTEYTKVCTNGERERERDDQRERSCLKK